MDFLHKTFKTTMYFFPPFIPGVAEPSPAPTIPPPTLPVPATGRLGFGQGGDRIPVRVRWFYCQPQAKILPYPHAFASAGWDMSSEWNPYIGEKQQFDEFPTYARRNTPTTATGQRTCGTAEQWLNGLPAPAQIAVQYDDQSIPFCCHTQVGAAAIGNLGFGPQTLPQIQAIAWQGNKPAGTGALVIGATIPAMQSIGLTRLQISFPTGNLVLSAKTFAIGNLSLSAKLPPSSSIGLGPSSIPSLSAISVTSMIPATGNVSLSCVTPPQGNIGVSAKLPAQGSIYFSSLQAVVCSIGFGGTLPSTENTFCLLAFIPARNPEFGLNASPSAISSSGDNGGNQTNIDWFDQSGAYIWTAPITGEIRVRIWGTGGSKAGGGGAYSESILSVVVGTDYALFIPVLGTNLGSWFSDPSIAYADYGRSGPNGAGGQASNCIGDITRSGGNGSSLAGGGGAGGRNGTNGADGVGSVGGAGGGGTGGGTDGLSGGGAGGTVLGAGFPLAGGGSSDAFGSAEPGDYGGIAIWW